MQVVCHKTCQIRIDEQIHFIERGAVLELDELPDNGCFKELQGKNYIVDFLTAGEEELMKTKWKASEALEVINDEFDLDLIVEKGDKKSDVVKMILDARYRAV